MDVEQKDPNDTETPEPAKKGQRQKKEPKKKETKQKAEKEPSMIVVCKGVHIIYLEE